MKNFTIAFLAAASLFSFGCKKKGGDDVAQAAAKMEQMASAMCECKDKACAEKVQGDMVKWAEEMQKKYAGKEQPKPDEAMQKRIDAATTKLTECTAKAMGAGEAAAPTEGAAAEGAAAEGAEGAEGAAAEGAAAEGAAAAGDIPQECQDYKAAVEGLAKCDKIPAETKDAMTKGFEQASAAWASLPAEAKAQAAESCKVAADAVKQAAAACN